MIDPHDAQTPNPPPSQQPPRAGRFGITRYAGVHNIVFVPAITNGEKQNPCTHPVVRDVSKKRKVAFVENSSGVANQSRRSLVEQTRRCTKDTLELQAHVPKTLTPGDTQLHWIQCLLLAEGERRKPPHLPSKRISTCATMLRETLHSAVCNTETLFGDAHHNGG